MNGLPSSFGGDSRSTYPSPIVACCLRSLLLAIICHGEATENMYDLSQRHNRARPHSRTLYIPIFLPPWHIMRWHEGYFLAPQREIPTRQRRLADQSPEHNPTLALTTGSECFKPRVAQSPLNNVTTERIVVLSGFVSRSSVLCHSGYSLS